MATNVATINAREQELMSQLGGQQSDDRSNSLPMLKINMQEEDDQGRELKRGKFFLTGTDTPAYTDHVTIRPMGQFFQWTQYDAIENKLKCKTIYVTKLTQEARDTNGTLKCGKPASKVLRENPELAKKYEDITCWRVIFALVSYTGETATGEKVTVTDQPCVLRLKGANFGMADKQNPGGWEDDFMNQLPKTHAIWNYKVDLTTKRAKKGSVTYFVIQFKTIMDYLPTDEATFEMLDSVLKRVQAENAIIEKQYADAIRKRTSADEDGDLADVLEDAPFEYDLADELED